MATPKFKVRLRGAFHSFELYDAAGREVFELAAAIAEAERQYGPDWTEVYNGEEGASREEGDDDAPQGAAPR
jgi:hypothetical protein